MGKGGPVLGRYASLPMTRAGEGREEQPLEDMPLSPWRARDGGREEQPFTGMPPSPWLNDQSAEISWV